MKSTNICIALIATLLTSITLAQTSAPADSAYAGAYRRSEAETVAELFILKDHTFCYSFMGGALNLLAAGRWTADANPEKGIHLQEVRLNQSAFPTFVKQVAKQGDDVVFNIEGYSIANANSPVFATSSTEAAPSRFRPLFRVDNNQGKESYTLPPIKAKEARYFFVGYVETDEYRQPTRLKVIQYKLEGANSVMIAYDNVQTTPLMKLSAKLSGSRLLINDAAFGHAGSLSAEALKEIQGSCINPILNPRKCDSKNKSECDKAAAEQGTMLVPVKTFYTDLKAIKGNPLLRTED